MTKSRQFVHTHVHSDYSMLDGAASVKSIVEAAHKFGQPAVTISDHGNMGMIPDLFENADRLGINPIPALEAYHVDDVRDKSKAAEGEKERAHLILIGTSNEGFHNAMRLSSMGHLEGWHRKPNIDNEMLAKHSEGLVITTSCLGSQVNQALIRDDYEKARRIASNLKDMVGPDRFFIEVQDHGIPEQIKILPSQVKLAKDLGVGLLAAQDSHYIRREDADLHDSLLCVQTGRRKNDPTRWKFSSDENYFRSSEEMWELFPEDMYPGACSNTLLIAEMTKVDNPVARNHFLIPKFPLPSKYATAEDMLRDLTYKGAARLYGDRDGNIPNDVRDRIEYELGIIISMGFVDYTLIVADLIAFARSQNILVGPGRGSGAGSIVNYCMGITTVVDPLHHKLYFERYLNPHRLTMPDIDIDFQIERRHEVVNYVIDKYGEEHVSQICNWQRFAPLSSIEAAARVLDYPISLGAEIKMEMPRSVDQYQISIANALLPEDEVEPLGEKAVNAWRKAKGLRSLHDKRDDCAEILDLAMGFEGTVRTTGRHAAGVLITPGPAIDHVPLFRKTDAGVNLTQFDKDGIDKIGGLKLDFLGLAFLSIIMNALHMIREDTGRVIEPFGVSSDDPAVYRMIANGDVGGLFQINGKGMRELLVRMQPDCFDDISAAVALYRPGPMDHDIHLEYADRKAGRKPVKLLHPDMGDILGDTLGLIVYQEQVMLLAEKFAGYSGAESDTLRRAMGKKKKEVMDEQKAIFVERCIGKGYSPDLARNLWDTIEPFAGYAFNKAHSVSYAVITYMTAWLKCHYPVQYTAALMSVYGHKNAVVPDLIEYCKDRGVVVSTPDINKSKFGTSTYEGNIWLGLTNVRGVGGSAAQKIIPARANGPFESIQDFLIRTRTNRSVTQSLIMAGAFDSLHPSRKGMIDNLDDIIEASRNVGVDYGSLDTDLFGLSDELDTVLDSFDLDVPDYPADQKRRDEYEVLEMFAGEHPYEEYRDMIADLKAVGNIPSDAFEATDENVPIGRDVRLYGVLGGSNVKTSKNGRVRSEFWVETGLGKSVESIIFGSEVNERLRGSLIVCDGVLKEDVVITVDPESKEEVSELRRSFQCKSISRVDTDLSPDKVRRHRIGVVDNETGETVRPQSAIDRKRAERAAKRKKAKEAQEPNPVPETFCLIVNEGTQVPDDIALFIMENADDSGSKFLAIAFKDADSDEQRYVGPITLRDDVNPKRLKEIVTENGKCSVMRMDVR